MGRLDRRRNIPTPQDLRKSDNVTIMNDTILPQNKHGLLDYNTQFISLNRSVQRLGFQKKGSSELSQLENRYMNQGGVSPLFGKNEKLP